MFKSNSNKESEKKFAHDYFILISHFIKKIIDEHKKTLDIIKNNEDSFKFEFLVLIFWLSMQKFANIFDDQAKQDRILNAIHNIYYSFLSTARNIKGDDLRNVRNNINSRYRSYDSIGPCNNNENWLLDLSRQFAGNIDYYDKSDFKNDLMVVVTISQFIKLFFEITEIYTPEFIKENYEI